MPDVLPYTQEDFSGGINLIDADTKLAPNEYRIGYNIRTRFGPCEPVKSAIDITPDDVDDLGLVQGLYAFGSILVMFAGGLAYYKLSTDDTWINIAGFSMSATATRIYATIVPISSMNYKRVNVSAANEPSAGINLDITNNSASPACLVCQDGINQPWLIFGDGTTRISNTYADWTTVDREYVPIGLQMVFFSNILFIVAPDGKSIYRSVSGRPLDFIVAIDQNGAKISNAVNTSHAVDGNEIKLLDKLNTQSLIVITAYNATAVTPDFTSLLFGEPRFKNTPLFSAGVVNQFSMVDILGDFALIDFEGIKSFNAVLQLTFEGNNSVLSKKIARMFKGVIQTDPCSGLFDNYAFFSLRTVYSDACILVFDTISKVFVSVDIPTVRAIKQFATTYTPAGQKFYAITDTGVFQLYTTSEEVGFEVATLTTRALDWMNSDLERANLVKCALKGESIHLLFEGAAEEGAFSLTQVVDNRIDIDQITGVARQYTGVIEPITSGFLVPAYLPWTSNVTNDANDINIPTDGSSEGMKISYNLIWTKGAKLDSLQMFCKTNTSFASMSQQNKIYA